MISRRVDAALRFLGVETAESQAQSLAAAGVRAGQLTQAEADDLLKELRKQTQIMEKDSRPPRVNVDAHTE